MELKKILSRGNKIAGATFSSTTCIAQYELLEH
jgi:hypothetical protein